jgi:hypothetical protein
VMAPALIGVPSFDVFTEPEEDFLFSSFLSVFKHLSVDLNEFSVFSVFVLIPSIAIVDFCLLLFFDDFLMFTQSLIGPEIVVVFRIGEEISGH